VRHKRAYQRRTGIQMHDRLKVQMKLTSTTATPQSNYNVYNLCVVEASKLDGEASELGCPSK